MRELFDDVYGQMPLAPEEAVRQSSRAPLRKRFYKTAGYRKTADGFEITLDDKTVRTPSRRPVVVPAEPIAELIAGEWNAQGEFINPMTMPVLRLANSVVEGVVDNVVAVADDMARYFESDLLCYRADSPESLQAREAELWDPVLAWAHQTYGAPFVLSQSIMHVAQPERTLRAMRDALPTDAWSVAAMHLLTTLTGSALLALALYRGRLSGDETWSAANVDEDWNIETWGLDEEVEARRISRKRDFDAVAAVVAALTMQKDQPSQQG